MTETYLNDVWTFYFHDPNSNDWTNESYKLLGTISTTDEFWQHFILVKEHIHKGIFFFMRDYVFPSWDDPANLDGGCLSIKVLKEHVPSFFEDVAIKLLGETLLHDTHRIGWDKVNGISTSPKKHFCIIKIWVKDDCLSEKALFDFIPSFYGDILYKSNRENIQNDQAKR
jgi:hypothetical protein